MYSEVRGSPGWEARRVRMWSATVKRVLTFICNDYRYEWGGMSRGFGDENGSWRETDMR